MNKKWKAIVAICAISIGFLAFKATPVGDRTFEIVKNLDIFATLFKEVNAYYVDDIHPDQLMRTGITAMLASLDPYTNYIPEDDIEDYRTITTGEYGGIGAIVDKKGGVSTVVMPYEGYPAHKAGLKAGDQILKINGIVLEGKSSDAISKLLKGQSNSDIVLTVKRFGQEKLFDVTLARERITISNVPYFGMVAEGIGYVKLTDFTTEAGAEVRNAVNELKADGAKKIILDLRGNPGGLLEEAVNVSNVFVGKGREVVTTRGKLKNWTKTYNTLNDPADTQIPLAVLISNGSASASEIVAGVMQDYDRGVLVGQRSYGKGLVQQTRPLAYNSQLKVTTGKYYIPSGRCIQAIDYSHRNPDGSIGKIPDSLKSEFKTQSGRSVFDGGGVNPDIEVEPFEYAPIAYSLMSNDLVFDYATRYYYAHPEIKPAKDFTLTDAEYDEFKNWLKDKELNYTTQVEQNIEKLIASAKQEKYYQDIEQQIMDLKRETLHNKDQDLITFKPEIKKLLEQEIAGRYYFQSGMIESTFDQDREVMEAIKVLNDSERYQSILKGK
ncbi:S41 family peptidase [Marinoscillum sp. 108]|uniref:S41 family peptidase n=1 Tax=Marinoscillum luteum TaxID=861051 RepID=A0ABW7N5W4_9BACT|nr:S41 family peptidase [Marinoscillum sp. 108]VXD21087.1 S41A family C-terminal processing peptidase-3 [Marinoscillum sp. 108]